jgi:hypothetical protein
MFYVAQGERNQDERMKKIDGLWHDGADLLCRFEEEHATPEREAEVIRGIRRLIPPLLLLTWGPGAWGLGNWMRMQSAKLSSLSRWLSRAARTKKNEHDN